MSELRYPNESTECRDARDLLSKSEQELIDKVNLWQKGAVRMGQ